MGISNRLEINPGEKYGMLIILNEAAIKRLPCGQVTRIMTCKCECGQVKDIRLLHLIRGRISSCGCLGGEKHGEGKTLLYNVWRGMKNRCYSESYKERHLYLDRGITIDNSWNNSYLTFKKWALENGWAPSLQIDRKNTDGNYEPNNCRFVTAKVNCNNRRCTIYVKYNNEKTSLQLILEQKGLSNHIAAIRTRILRGWNEQKAIDTPIKKGNYKRNLTRQPYTLQGEPGEKDWRRSCEESGSYFPINKEMGPAGIDTDHL